jgi:hypothetical protein
MRQDDPSPETITLGQQQIMQATDSVVSNKKRLVDPKLIPSAGAS